jgi:queuine tRNA-ribosyltransferase
MNTNNLGFIPLLFDGIYGTTHDNWQKAGITTLSCSLQTLLCKPGLEALYQFPDLATFLNWPGSLVLNAHLEPPRHGKYNLHSVYDGSQFQISPEELLRIIKHLKPQYVLMPLQIETLIPPDFWKDWPASIFPFFPLSSWDNDFLPTERGWTLSASDLDYLPTHKKNGYLYGNLEYSQIKQLQKLDFMGIESNQPIVDACKGLIYTEKGLIDLKESTMAMQFEVLEANCLCETCSQSFTKAYLHHLLANTPLLAERLLIMHNVTRVQQWKAQDFSEPLPK